MDADKKARIARIVGFICLGLALLNVTIAVLAMIADKNANIGSNVAVAGGLFVVGMVNLTRGRRRPPPDA